MTSRIGYLLECGIRVARDAARRRRRTTLEHVTGAVAECPSTPSCAIARQAWAACDPESERWLRRRNIRSFSAEPDNRRYRRSGSTGCGGLSRLSEARVGSPISAILLRRSHLRLRTWRPFDTPRYLPLARLTQYDRRCRPPHRRLSAGLKASVSTRRLRASALR